jgi:hypothetical protein
LSAPNLQVSIFSCGVAAKTGVANPNDAANPAAAINRTVMMASYARSSVSMILSENRFPLFWITP